MPVFESDRHQDIASSSDRKFGLLVGGIVLVLGALPLLHARAPHWWAVGLGAVLVGAALVRPGLLAPVNKAWTMLGFYLGKVVTPVVMGVLLYVVIAPVGLIQRLFGRDQLHCKWDKNAASYWEVRRAADRPASSMINQF